MDALGQFFGQSLVDHPMLLDTGLAIEGSRHDLYLEMRLAFRPRTGMAGMFMRLIDDIQFSR
jgi:hypothetical protein